MVHTDSPWSQRSKWRLEGEGSSSVQSLGRVGVFATPWTAAGQASLSITNSRFTQTHVHRVGNAIQTSHPLSSPSPPAFHNFPSIRVFSYESFLHITWLKYWVSASASVLLMNIQDWFPLGLNGLISLQSKGLPRVFSNTTVQKHQFLLSFLYSPALTSICDYWKNHSLD